MAEKPILMSGPMVRALAGQKTVTRRPIKPLTLPSDHARAMPDGTLRVILGDGLGAGEVRETVKFLKPRFQPGDIAWVKETWRTDGRYDGHKPSEIPQGAPIEYLATDMPWLLGRCRPSIFMCRWMSRSDLRVIDVRPERVQDITEEEARLEGISDDEALVGQIINPYRTAFAVLWDKIHGPGAFCRNDWVWRYEFEPYTQQKETR